MICILEADRNEPDFGWLAEATLPPGGMIQPTRFPSLHGVEPNQAGKLLLRWLRSSTSVFHSAAGSADFFERTAKAVVDIVGLDCCRVLLLEGDEWRVEAEYIARSDIPGVEVAPSRRVLDSVRCQARTFWELPRASMESMQSLAGVAAVVASPILDGQGQVVGAVYGSRHGAGLEGGITELAATLVEVLACGVAAGLARIEQEQAAARARVQFEQFFTPELSRELAAHPDLLNGRDAEIAVLFCDIRDFSSISERLGPTKTVEWVGAVMDRLSGCVRRHSGVLVDYIGDALMAMWGAPEPQERHSQLACLAALDMLAAVPQLNRIWKDTLGQPIELSIGINTGPARVGNVGSRYKFKYGPLGNSVNVASRVQGATKYLRCPVLVTGGTEAGLSEDFARRRLCRIRVVHVTKPVDVYELAPPGQPNWLELKQDYERALELFESRAFTPAAQVTGNLLGKHPEDGPSLLLLSRAVNAMVETPADFDPVWELPGK
jgi:adenylate cyclase